MHWKGLYRDCVKGRGLGLSLGLGFGAYDGRAAKGELECAMKASLGLGDLLAWVHNWDIRVHNMTLGPTYPLYPFGVILYSYVSNKYVHLPCTYSVQSHLNPSFLA